MHMPPAVELLVNLALLANLLHCLAFDATDHSQQLQGQARGKKGAHCGACYIRRREN